MGNIGTAQFDPCATNLGTPQDSVLGSLVFIPNTNDLSDHLSEGELFA